MQADTELSPESADVSMSSRADWLLFLSNIDSLWKLHVKKGEGQPDEMIRPETFGIVKTGQLSPCFVARAALQIILRNVDAPRPSVPEW